MAVATAVALMGGVQLQRYGMARPDAVLWTLLYVPLVGLVGLKLTMLVRTWNGVLARRAEASAGRGRLSRISGYHLCGAGLSFAQGILLSVGGVVLGTELIPRIHALFPPLHAFVLTGVIVALIGLGAAALLGAFRLRPLMLYVLIGVGTGVLLRLL